MNEKHIIPTHDKLYSVAIHEAGHLVARYVLFGNIDTIKYVTIVPHGSSLGSNKEDEGLKSKESSWAFDHDDDFYDTGGYLFKECCYSYAGGFAEMIIMGLDAFPEEGAIEDNMSLDSFLDMYYYDTYNPHLKEDAFPAAEKLVRDYIDLIKRVADALIAAPGHQLNNLSLSALLSQC